MRAFFVTAGMLAGMDALSIKDRTRACGFPALGSSQRSGNRQLIRA
jgi:hypothetical protein